VNTRAGWRRPLYGGFRDDLVVAVVPWVASRVLVGVAYGVARLAADEHDLDPAPLADGGFAVPLQPVAERLTSIERYALSAVPIVVVAAMLTERPAVERAVLALTASAMVVLAALAWLGAYTP
jgi:VIT1/CCC1 family predicted Fe2+/Mn2+ transporter